MDDRYTHARYGTAKLWMRLGGTLRYVERETDGEICIDGIPLPVSDPHYTKIVRAFVQMDEALTHSMKQL